MSERVFYFALEQRVLLDAALTTTMDSVQEPQAFTSLPGADVTTELSAIAGLLVAFAEQDIGQAGETFIDFTSCLTAGTFAGDNAPLAIPQSFSMYENDILQASVTALDDSDLLKFLLLEDVTHGNLSFEVDGDFTYTALPDLGHLDAGEQVSTTFTFVASDDEGHMSQPTSVAITISGLDMAFSPIVDVSVEEDRRRPDFERDLIRPEINLDVSSPEPEVDSVRDEEPMKLARVEISNIPVYSPAEMTWPFDEADLDDDETNDADIPGDNENPEDQDTIEIDNQYVPLIEGSTPSSHEPVAFDILFYEKLDKAAFDGDPRARSRNFIKDVMTLPVKRV